MSDEELSKAIDRLKLQAEFNKQYVLATQPSSALAKADRFFDSPTGKAVLDFSKAALPTVNTIVGKTLDANLKYANKLDREKMEADIAKTKADTAKAIADSKKDNKISDLERREKEANITNTLAKAQMSKATAAKNYKELLGDDYSYFWTSNGELGINRKKKR